MPLCAFVPFHSGLFRIGNHVFALLNIVFGKLRPTAAAQAANT